MSPTRKHEEMLSRLHSEMKSWDGVHSLELRHDPHAGLGQGDMIHGRDVMCVRLVPGHQNDESREMAKNFFWKKVRELGISPTSVSLELDNREYPVFDPPL